MRSIAHRLIRLLALILGLSGLPAEALAQACAMCRTAVQSPDDPLVRGINLSVAILLIMPLALVGSIGGWLLFAYRRAHRLAAAGGALVAQAPEKGTIPGITEDTP